MNDLSHLTSTIAALQDKADETNTTLLALVLAIQDLKAAAPADQQAAIDALTAQAEGILAGLTAAEDNADDSIPTPPLPV